MSGIFLAAALQTQWGTDENPSSLYTVALLAAVATVCLWIWWYFTKPKERVMDGQDSQEQKEVKGDAAQLDGSGNQVVQGEGNVVSYNQSGGITAGTVQIGHQPRTFGGRVPVATIERLKQYAGTGFDITAVMGGGDSASFADEITQLLTMAEWKLRGQGTAMMTPTPRGLQLHIKGEESAAAAELAACLAELRLGATIRANSKMGTGPKDDDDVILVLVGV